MEARSRWLRSLGYVLDGHDRWIHPTLKVAALRPELLEECEPDQVSAFHDAGSWQSLDETPKAPHLPGPVMRAAREQGLTWRGWMGAWETPAGVFLATSDLLALGAEGLRRRIERWRRWRSERSLRSLAACLGMGAMVLWLVTGWMAGPSSYLLGMAAIASVTWVLRPQPAPDDLWAGLDTGLLERRLAQARDLLGPAWSTLAYETVAVDDERLYFTSLDRLIRLRTLRERFTPEGLQAILEVLVPLSELEDE